MSTTAIAMIGLYVVAVFILDLLTPLGIPVWLLYVLPFLFLNEATSRYHVYGLATVSIILTHLGYFFSPEGQPEPLTNRYIATIVLLAMVLVLSHRRA